MLTTVNPRGVSSNSRDARSEGEVTGVKAMDRRKLLKTAGLTALGLGTTGLVYPFLEAKWCRVVRRTIVLPNLPGPFRGTTVALLADVHHGPFVPLAYIRHVVSMTNALKPDIVALVGDFVHKEEDILPWETPPLAMPLSCCHTIPTLSRL
jgi:hypothetical protein